MATKKRKAPVSSKPSNKAMMDELRNIALVGAGVVVGSLGGQMIDKMLGVDSSATTMNPKAFVRPALLAGGGAYGTVKSKNKMVKLMSAGVGVAGVLTGAKMLMKKDFLAGLGNADMGSPFYIPDGEIGMYQEPLNMSIEKYSPNLPMLTSMSSMSNDMEEISGMDESADFEII